MANKLISATSSGNNIIFKVNAGASASEAFRIASNGMLNLSAGASGSGTFSLDGAVTINESGANVDFRVEGDTDANLLFADASADKVGIGTNAPISKFETLDSIPYLPDKCPVGFKSEWVDLS